MKPEDAMEKEIINEYKQGKSLPEISKRFGINYSKTRLIVMNAKIMRSRNESLILAGKQGRLGKGKHSPLSEKHKKNLSISAQKRGELYSIGLSKKPNGYLEITRGPNKGQGLHRNLMEKHLQRKLQKGECVHHIDEDKLNNRIENLVIMTREEHARLHALNAASKRERDQNGKFA